MREYWHELGANVGQYKPKWSWTKRAYVEGLRDAARIVELQAWSHHSENHLGREINCREAIKTIHAYSVKIAPELNK